MSNYCNKIIFFIYFYEIILVVQIYFRTQDDEGNADSHTHTHTQIQYSLNHIFKPLEKLFKKK